MTRPRRRTAGWLAALACLCADLVLLPGAIAAAGADTSATVSRAPARATADTKATPLRVSIDTLAPGVIPRRGRVTVTGRITNRSQQTWSTLNVYLLTSPDPLRSRSELADAARTEETAEVGRRLTDDGLYRSVGELAPGKSVRYRLSVRRSDLGLSGRPGVYWVGVHVLGSADGQRATIGRARTFMPLMPAPNTAAGDRSRTRVAMVLPIRTDVRRGPAGRLIDVSAWDRLLAPDGRLTRLLDLSARSERGLTWVVDPAVVDAVQSLARGNPSADPPDETSRRPTTSSSPSSSASPSASSSSSSSGSSGDDGEAAQPSRGGGTDSTETRDGSARARAWLDEFRRQASQHTVMALPYGDLDVSTTLRGSRYSSLFGRAVDLGRATLRGNGVESPATIVAPESGFLAPAALRRLDPRVPVLLGEKALTPPKDSPVAVDPDEAPVLVADTAAGSGGPAPNSPYSALAVRQRVLSEAALAALSPRRGRPLVVALPARWDPGARSQRSDFFAALDQPWLQPVDVPSVVTTAPDAPAGQKPTDQRVSYPAGQRSAELSPLNLRTSAGVARIGRIQWRLLTGKRSADAGSTAGTGDQSDDQSDDSGDSTGDSTGNSTGDGTGTAAVANLADTWARAGLLASSQTLRADAATGRLLGTEQIDHVSEQLAGVRVEGPQFVMMSGESGPVSVTLVNQLKQTVTVGLAVSTPESDLRIRPVTPRRLGPGQRATVQLSARSDDIGVHQVTLRVTDVAGAPIGSQTQFNVRTSHVSTVIWVVMGVGGALLFMAIVVRLVRRVRRRKSTHGPMLPQEPSPLPSQPNQTSQPSRAAAPVERDA